MKKTYIIPNTKVVQLHTCHLLMQSTLDVYQSGTGNGTVLIKEDNVSSSSSRYNVWDDDWSD